MKGKLKIIIPVIIGLFVIIGVACLVIFKDSLFGGSESGDSSSKEKSSKKTVKSELKMDDNSLSDFDLYFLKLENNGKNKVYSPLSIKYALEMLSEGADGDTKAQIDAVIGEYSAKKYENSTHMSFANALFINNDFKDSIKEDYVKTLKNNYNAEIMFDSFSSPNVINDWVNKKTFKLIPNLLDDVSDKDYVLVNALAIDMEWNKKIQSEHEYFDFTLEHEKVKAADDAEYAHDFDYGVFVSALDGSGYHSLTFKGYSKPAKSVHIAAVANKYDIISELGEDSIKSTVQTEYNNWLKDPQNAEDEKYYGKFDINTYMKEIKTNYGKIGSSTDFMFYDDEDVKVFAKDLKTYDGTTLQYVGIMPKKDSLETYIDNIEATDLNKVIGGLKSIELDSFEDGYVTIVEGYIPMFKFDYELKLMDDLKGLGIEDVFDSEKSDLSNLSSSSSFIDTAVHKANIEFSNDGIKASAATAMGGMGAADGGFKYYFEAPVKRINLTFDNPYMYLVRDKDTGEIWFAGTVYEPVEFVTQSYGY